MPNTTTAPRPRRKAIYHIRNWPACDRALVQRGSLTLWVSEDVIDTWCYQGLRSEVRSLTTLIRRLKRC
jgi:hypothetical protein